MRSLLMVSGALVMMAFLWIDRKAMLDRISAARTSLIASKPLGGHNRRADALPRPARKLG
jgi:hypothetical protein